MKDALRELRRVGDRNARGDDESLTSSPWSLSSEDEAYFEEQIAFEDWFDKLKSCVETEEICQTFTTQMRLTLKRCPMCGVMRAPMCARRSDEDTCHGCAGRYVSVREGKRKEETTWIPNPRIRRSCSREDYCGGKVTPE